MTPNAATLRSASRLAVLPAPYRDLGEGLVARARLVRRLTEVHDIALAVLVAPAGYGKTTTLLEWAQYDERPFAWVALHRADDEAEHLRASVARATDPLTRRGRDFVLVLDDVQVLRSRGAIDVLRRSSRIRLRARSSCWPRDASRRCRSGACGRIARCSS